MHPPFVSYPPQGFFNEDEFLAILFSVQRLRYDADRCANKLVRVIPGNLRTKYFPSSYCLTGYGLAHILDKHFYKVNRFPDASKFTIPITEIVRLIRLGFLRGEKESTKTGGTMRVLEVGKVIGVCKDGCLTRKMAIVTDGNGQIRSAYPIC